MFVKSRPPRKIDWHEQPNDGIRGEQLIAVARDISRKKVVAGSSTHQRQMCTLRKSAECYMDKTFEYVKAEDSA